MKKTVIELFAGVGGFRVGLNKIKKINKDGKANESDIFHFVWFNQWEPSTKKQYAYECYCKRFDENYENSNQDINKVDKNTIPSHSLLVGGFPCQDYSVARSLVNEKGIKGKKGVLWWQIYEILSIKNTPFVLLENVDRLLKSPAKQRGRDFGIILKCLSDLGYDVEWRVINAADYSMPQRRRRTFIFAYKRTTKYSKKINSSTFFEIVNSKGIFAQKFPIKNIDKDLFKQYDLKKYKELALLSKKFKFDFNNSGVVVNGVIYTAKSTPKKFNYKNLDSIVIRGVDNKYYLSREEIEKFNYLRGEKKIPRKSKSGKEYLYSEGSMSPYDSLDLPGRTMLTSEGTINRSTHIIKDPITNRKRKLTPIECERLNQFPDDWTNTMPERNRYFMMGNALVCGIVEKLGEQLSIIIENE